MNTKESKEDIIKGIENEKKRTSIMNYKIATLKNQINETKKEIQRINYQLSSADKQSSETNKEKTPKKQSNDNKLKKSINHNNRIDDKTKHLIRSINNTFRKSNLKNSAEQQLLKSVIIVATIRILGLYKNESVALKFSAESNSKGLFEKRLALKAASEENFDQAFYWFNQARKKGQGKKKIKILKDKLRMKIAEKLYKENKLKEAYHQIRPFYKNNFKNSFRIYALIVRGLAFEGNATIEEAVIAFKRDWKENRSLASCKSLAKLILKGKVPNLSWRDAMALLEEADSYEDDVHIKNELIKIYYKNRIHMDKLSDLLHHTVEIGYNNKPLPESLDILYSLYYRNIGNFKSPSPDFMWNLLECCRKTPGCRTYTYKKFAHYLNGWGVPKSCELALKQIDNVLQNTSKQATKDRYSKMKTTIISRMNRVSVVLSLLSTSIIASVFLLDKYANKICI